MGRREALQVLGERVRLPTLPEVVVRLNGMIDDPTVGLHQLGREVARDPAMTARVLRIANSAFYGQREPVLSTEQAATVVGARSLRNIALQASIIHRYEHLSAVADFDLDELWVHAMYTAQLSHTLASLCGNPGGLSPEDYYTCGLLHDVGKVILLEGLGERYLEVLRHARHLGRALHLSEEECLGFTHVDVGSILAARWQLPAPVATAIEFHHGPLERVAADPVVAVVAIADQIAYRSQTDDFEEASGRLALLAQRTLGLEPEAFGAVAEGARELLAGIQV